MMLKGEFKKSVSIHTYEEAYKPEVRQGHTLQCKAQQS